jgi:TetR/AcrR family transcriptional regulator, transcriptional repressor for nem operon
MARSGKETKTAATEVLETLFVTLAGVSMAAPDREQARSDAIVALSTMIGAMTLARFVSNSALSAEILARAKEHVYRHAGPR